MREHTDVLELLRYRDLVRLNVVGNRMSLKRWIDDGRFPRPLRLGPNCVAWRRTEVEKFLEGCTAQNGAE